MTDKTINLSDEFCKKVALRADSILHYVPEQTIEQLKEKFTFSEKYSAWKKSVIQNENKPHRLSPAMKRIIIIAAIIATLIIGAMSVGAVRDFLYKLFLSFNTDHVVASYGYVSDSDAIIDEGINAIDVYYEPSYIPEGYSEVARDKTSVYFVVYYSNGNEMIEYQQSLIDTISQFDTENHSYTLRVLSNGLSVLCFSSEDKNVVAWSTDGGVFYIMSMISIDEIVKIAESVE